MKKVMVLLCLIATGCSHRYSLYELQEYDQAMKLSQEQGMDTQFMREQMAAMLTSYAKHPGEDPFVRSARQESQALGIAAAASLYEATKPQPQPMPMGFGEFTGGK